MSIILSGAPVASALRERIKNKTEKLKAQGVYPTLAVLSVGEEGDNEAYLRGLSKQAEACGIELLSENLPADVSQSRAEEALRELGNDPAIHGILLLRPLPKSLNETALCRLIPAENDVDCATDLSLAGVFSHRPLGFPPATPRAVMEMLAYYQIPLAGKRAVIVGRSLVVGRPLAMMLLKEDATVTLCHSKTDNLEEICRQADILVAALGRPRALSRGCFRPGQVLVDVGIHRLEDGSLCGDLDFGAAEPLAEAITPVPGGVGTVTTAVLLSHVITAAENNIL